MAEETTIAQITAAKEITVAIIGKRGTGVAASEAAEFYKTVYKAVCEATTENRLPASPVRGQKF